MTNTVHAKLLQKEKEIMSINYTATISMNYTTWEPKPPGTHWTTLGL